MAPHSTVFTKTRAFVDQITGGVLRTEPVATVFSVCGDL